MLPRLCALLFCLTGVLAGITPAAAEMPRIALSAGIHSIKAEVAYTDPMRQQGLMHRRVMAPQEGMLFVFERPQRFCMWMKNTYLPLSVAFLDDSGTVLNIEDMAPQTETSHCASKPARYALEMNLGWFEKRGIRPGSKISGIERALGR
jgi:uncharacterized protein